MRKTASTPAVNSLKHGLTARTIAIPGLEEHGDWLNFREAILDSLVPDNALETELAMRTELFWRLRRVARAEQQSVDARRRAQGVTLAHMKENPVELPPDSIYASAFNASTAIAQIVPEEMLSEGDALDKILRSLPLSTKMERGRRCPDARSSGG